jgi:iron complex transport system substrate-binding protein
VREINELTREIVDAAYGIHTRLGPGLLESVYEAVLARVLEGRGLSVQRQAPVAFEYEGIHIEEGFRVDILVEECVVVELKSVERLAPVHTEAGAHLSQDSGPSVGLLINFGAPTIKERSRRIANRTRSPPRPSSCLLCVSVPPA